MSDEILDKINRFIIANRWEYNFPLTRETQLQRDLKIWGDDADEILIKFSEEFHVDVSQFPLGKYFEDEGDQTFLDIVRFFSRKKKQPKKVLTIGDLERSVVAGRLDESVIGSPSVDTP
jgi:hypothetical protein